MLKKYFTEIRQCLDMLNRSDDIDNLSSLLAEFGMPGIHSNSRESNFGDYTSLYPENDPPQYYVVLENGSYFYTVPDDSDREYHWKFKDDNFRVCCEACGDYPPLVDAIIDNGVWLCEHCYYCQTYNEFNTFPLTMRTNRISL